MAHLYYQHPSSYNDPFRSAQIPYSTHAPQPLDYSNGSHAMNTSSSHSSHSSSSSGPHSFPTSSNNTVYGSPLSDYRENYDPQLANIDLKVTEPTSNHKQSRTKHNGKSGGHSTPSSYTCLVPNCTFSTARAHDLKRHVNLHSGVESFLCKYKWCNRGKDGKPFSRKDHLCEHLRKVHGMPIAKKNQGGKRDSQ